MFYVFFSFSSSWVLFIGAPQDVLVYRRRHQHRYVVLFFFSFVTASATFGESFLFLYEHNKVEGDGGKLVFLFGDSSC